MRRKLFKLEKQLLYLISGLATFAGLLLSTFLLWASHVPEANPFKKSSKPISVEGVPFSELVAELSQWNTWCITIGGVFIFALGLYMLWCWRGKHHTKGFMALAVLVTAISLVVQLGFNPAIEKKRTWKPVAQAIHEFNAGKLPIFLFGVKPYSLNLETEVLHYPHFKLHQQETLKEQLAQNKDYLLLSDSKYYQLVKPILNKKAQTVWRGKIGKKDLMLLRGKNP